MPIEFRPATPEDLPEIANLMQIAFEAGPDAPFLDHDLLRWKYFEPGPEWDGARSYVLRQDGKLVAHGCVWPVRIMFEGRLHSGICLLDWVASKIPRGSGIQLVRKLDSRADFTLSIGGSEATRHIMPRIGFERVWEQRIYARVLRPFRQFRTRPGSKTPREIARLLRNTAYWLAPKAIANTWSAREVEAIENRLLADSQSSAGPASIHQQAFIRYIRRCPAAHVRTYELLRKAKPSGYLVLSRVNGQSRIAELRIDSRDETDRKAALATAVKAALDTPEACELVAIASGSVSCDALEANGFRLRDRRPVFLQDPKKLIQVQGAPWDLTMLDDDSAFLNIPEHPYLT